MNLLKNPTLFQEKSFINNNWVTSDNNKIINVENPFDGRVIGHIPDCGRDETERAIQAAHKAFQSWKKFTALQRAKVLHQWAQLIDDNLEDLAILMTLEQGKPLTESRSEIVYANGFIKWFAEEGRRVYGDIIPSNSPKQQLFVIKQPIGVVGAITPWNFPCAMITRKCAPAFAAGCTVVLKPASETPFSALALAVLAEQAGMPPGVFNIVTGDAKAIGGELTSNPLVKKISFTGSTKVGKLLMQQSATTMKKLSLELGGNAPFIIFDDANLETAVKGAMASKFRNAGQTCVCANRILVQDTVYDTFSEKLIHAVKQVKMGDGLKEDTQIGPLISKAGIEKVERHIADAVSKGAKVMCGGKKSAVGNLFFEPTVLMDVTPDMLIAREETFGPVAPIFRFHSDEEAIQMANDTEFGLASYFYSESMRRIWQTAEQLEYGIVGVNTGIISTEVAPFGGVKESGMGREGSKYGIEDYVEIKYINLTF
jgi:succinate-semialdehyde dehydrogenase/glutarate-semialdehyde dehydrogenase